MTQLSQALAAMNQVGVINGQSDSALVAEVLALATHKGKAPPPKHLSPVSALNANHSVRMIDALRDLAEATGLSYSKSIFPYQREWAVRRYIGIGAAPSPRFGLTMLGQRITGNYRRVLSEDLGIAFGLTAAKTWCRATIPNARVMAVDIDLVLTRGYQRVGRRRRSVMLVGKRRPDYLLLAWDPASPQTVLCRLLECKGTATASYMPEQLRSGLGQLSSIKVGGVIPGGLTVCTFTGRDRWRFIALDPADVELKFEVDDDLLGILSNGPYFQASKEGNSLLVENHQQWGAAAVSASLANLAAFGGNDGARDRFMPPELTDTMTRDVTSDRREIDTPGGGIRGTVSQVSVGDDRFEVIQGLHGMVDDALNSPNPIDVFVAQGELMWSDGFARVEARTAGQAQPAPAEGLGLEDEPTDLDSAWSFGNSGTVLGIRRV